MIRTFTIELLQLMMDSLLLFFFYRLVTHFLFKFSHLKNARIQSLFYLIPMGKLVIDFLLFLSSKAPIGMNLNPFGCSSLLGRTLAQWLPEKAQTENMTYNCFSIYKQLLSPLPNEILYFLAIGSFCIFFAVSFKKIRVLVMHQKLERRILQNAVIFDYKIENSLLKQQIEKRGIRIFVSSETTIPFTGQKKTIILPNTLLSTLSSEEIEAVIAHELEHLRCFDFYIKLFAYLFTFIFWWLPASVWKQKLHHAQELASDAGTMIYGIDSSVLAQAIVKSARHAKNAPSFQLLSCAFVGEGTFTKKRIEKLLKQELFKEPCKRDFLFIFSAIVICTSVWIC